MTKNEKEALITRLATLFDDAPTYFTMKDLAKIAFDYIEPQIREECARHAEALDPSNNVASAIRRAHP
jgi:hypothetical protein